MLYFNRIDISKGNFFNKTSASKGVTICHFWYFLNYNFMFQPKISVIDVMIY